MKKVIYTALLSAAIALPSYAATTPPAAAPTTVATSAAAANPKAAKIEKKRQAAIGKCTQAVSAATESSAKANLSGNWKMLADVYLAAANSFKKALNDLTAPDNRPQVGNLESACRKSAKQVEKLVKHAPKAVASSK